MNCDFRYAIGTRLKDGSYGLWAGPYNDQHVALSIIGESTNDFLLKLYSDGTHDVLYRWSERDLIWKYIYKERP